MEFLSLHTDCSVDIPLSLLCAGECNCSARNTPASLVLARMPVVDYGLCGPFNVLDLFAEQAGLKYHLYLPLVWLSFFKDFELLLNIEW